jgi:hypothetical protein
MGDGKYTTLLIDGSHTDVNEISVVWYGMVVPPPPYLHTIPYSLTVEEQLLTSTPSFPTLTGLF